VAKQVEIEARVLRIVEAVEDGAWTEDSRVELKTGWPLDDIHRAARQLAAHANAARGEPILWIIGVDQKRRIVKGADDAEFSNWWQAIEARFDDRVAPEPDCFAVHTEREVVAAITFDTVRAPYVVNVGEGGGQVSKEVPYRRGNGTQSARRLDLVRILVPVSRAPEVEVLRGALQTRDVGGALEWSVELSLYLVPRSEAVFLPWHRSRLSWWLDGRGFVDVVPGNGEVQITNPAVDQAAAAKRQQIELFGPALIHADARFRISYPTGEEPPPPPEAQRAILKLGTAADLTREILLDLRFERVRAQGSGGFYKLAAPED
jgi:hypothetical protein